MASKTSRNSEAKVVATFAAGLRQCFIENEDVLVNLKCMPREELNSFTLMIQILRDLGQYDDNEEQEQRYLRRREAFIRLRWDDYLGDPNAYAESPGFQY